MPCFTSGKRTSYSKWSQSVALGPSVCSKLKKKQVPGSSLSRSYPPKNHGEIMVFIYDGIKKTIMKDNLDDVKNPCCMLFFKGVLSAACQTFLTRCFLLGCAPRKKKRLFFCNFRCPTVYNMTFYYTNIVLYCIVLYCIVLYCIVLYCIVLYCIISYHVI